VLAFLVEFDYDYFSVGVRDKNIKHKKRCYENQHCRNAGQRNFCHD